MESINKMLNIGYEFTINDDTIRYDYLPQSGKPAADISVLLEDIKTNKEESLAYLKSVIRLSVNLFDGYQSGTYCFLTTDSTGAVLHTHQINAPKGDIKPAAAYIRQKYQQCARFTNVAAFLSKSTGLFTLFGSDIKRRVMQQIELDDIAATCPW